MRLGRKALVKSTEKLFIENIKTRTSTRKTNIENHREHFKSTNQFLYFRTSNQTPSVRQVKGDIIRKVIKCVCFMIKFPKSITHKLYSVRNFYVRRMLGNINKNGCYEGMGVFSGEEWPEC